MEDYRARFVEIYNKNITRPGADRLLSWLETTDFFTAPASTRYHGACEYAPTAMDVAWCKEANPSRFGFRLMSNPVPNFGFRDKVMPDVEKRNLETCMYISPSGKSLRSHLHRQTV